MKCLSNFIYGALRAAAGGLARSCDSNAAYPAAKRGERAFWGVARPVPIPAGAVFGAGAGNNRIWEGSRVRVRGGTRIMHNAAALSGGPVLSWSSAVFWFGVQELRGRMEDP